ncbi:hypothetical protein L249_6912, partial [Ophiocordyceps polyrhachis-furcata BCC 54312]
MASGNNNNSNSNSNRRWEFPFPSARTTTGRGVDHSIPPPPWSGSCAQPGNRQNQSPFGPASAAAAWASWMAGGENSPWWMVSEPEPYGEGRHRSSRRAGVGTGAGAGAGDDDDGPGFVGRRRQSDTTAANASSSSSSASSAAASSSNNDSATAMAGSDNAKNNNKAKGKSRQDGFTDLLMDDDSDGNFPDPAEVTPTEDDEDEQDEEPIRRPASSPPRAVAAVVQVVIIIIIIIIDPPPSAAEPVLTTLLLLLLLLLLLIIIIIIIPPKASTDYGTFSTTTPHRLHPPVDIYRHDRTYAVHVALPGARKADVGVDWDPQRACLRVAGVVHRPGDEDFLAGLVASERRVGVFDRSVSLPLFRNGPAAAGAEIDAAAITAKMEDGILVVNVPLKDDAEPNVQRVKID